MKNIYTILCIGLTALITSCGSTPTNGSAGKSKAYKSHAKFAARADYKQTYDQYINRSALAAASPASTHVIVDFSDQRMKLMQGSTVLIDAPCTTGRAGKRTPFGTFKLHDRIVNKRSTIYGTCYRNGKRVHGGDRRKCPVKYDKYVGAPLPYWQRLTGDGIGMHSSGSVKRFPASGGCIRLQPAIAKTVFSKTKSGTKIHVVQ